MGQGSEVGPARSERAVQQIASERTTLYRDRVGQNLLGIGQH